MGIFASISDGLTRSRDKFKQQMNILLDRGPDLDEEFWEELEETLILSDIGGKAAFDIVERLRDSATRLALPDAWSVLDLLSENIQGTFAKGGEEILSSEKAIVLFVGINGTGKTTTVGKLANEATKNGRKVILGSADTFRAAAIEQLAVWAERAQVEMVTRERGSDPASVCYETIERAEEIDADLVLIDTAGRLHTSDDLMRELEKVVNVVRKRAKVPVYTVLVIDATTGQNGLQQAREFDKALDLDALIITKLDGTAKGGIALAISHELDLPIIKIGVGEGIDDLKDFDPADFVAALIGDYDEEDLLDEADEKGSVIEVEVADEVVSGDVAADDSAATEIEVVGEVIEPTSGPASADAAEHEETVEHIETAELAEQVEPVDGADSATGSSSDGEGELPKMSWDEFVRMDDERKSEHKKHFWERW